MKRIGVKMKMRKKKKMNKKNVETFEDVPGIYIS